MSKKPKIQASQNKAKNVEIKPALPKRDQLYAIPGQLRQTAINALQNSAPRQLSVGQVNQLCQNLSQLRPISKETKG